MKLLRSKWWPVENRWTNEMETLHQTYVRSGAVQIWSHRGTHKLLSPGHGQESPISMGVGSVLSCVFSWFSQFVAWVYWSLGIFNRTQEICIWRPRFKLTHTSRTRTRRMCHRCFSSCLGIPSSIKLCSGWICVICQDIQLWSKDRHAQWVAVLWRVVHGSPSSNSLRSQMLKTNINCWINRNWLL